MASITEMPVQKRTEAFVDTLVALWRRSVEASHRFLAKGDIERIEPEAREGIAHVETLYVAWADADEKNACRVRGRPRRQARNAFRRCRFAWKRIWESAP